jgi:PKD repeat protein
MHAQPMRILAVGLLLLLLVGTVSALTLIANESVEGNLYQNTDGSAATLRNGAGEDVVINYDYIMGGYAESTSTTDVYDFQRRGGVTYNTSLLPSNAIISDVKLSAWGYQRDNYLGSLGASVIYFTPASDTTFAAGDYDATNFTRVANDITWANWVDSGWCNWSMNALGISSVVPGGYTHYMLTLSSDPDNSGLVWATGGVYSRYFYRGLGYNAGQYKSFLTINYTIPTSPPAFQIIIINESQDVNLYQDIDGSWPFMRTAPGTDVILNYSSLEGGDTIGHSSNATEWYDSHKRGGVRFPVNSSILSNDTVNSVTLSIWGYLHDNYLGVVNASVLSLTPASDATFIKEDYNATDFSRVAPDILWANWQEGAWNNWTITPSAINTDTFTNFMLTHSADADGTPLVYATGGMYSKFVYRGLGYNSGQYKAFLTLNISPADCGITPTASFTQNATSGTNPVGVKFTGTSTNGATSYLWSAKNLTGNNTWFSFSTVKSPTQSFGVGNWSINLTATGCGGSNISTQVAWVNVSAYPKPVSSFTDTPTTGVSPLRVQFTDTSTESPTSYLWGAKNVIGDDIWVTFSTAQNPNPVFGTGNWSINLTSTNQGGSNTSTQITFINVTAAPPLVHPVTYHVADMPGYQNPGVEPWATAYTDIINSANEGLTVDFSGTALTNAAWTTQGTYVRNMGLAYQLTGDTRYANKTVTALLNIRNPTNFLAGASYTFYRGDYAIAYDFIYPTRNINSTLTTANDTLIRDQLANTASELIDLIPVTGAVAPDGRDISLYTSLGVMGDVLSDYSNISIAHPPIEWKEQGTLGMFEHDPIWTTAPLGLFNLMYDNSSGKGYLDYGYTAYFDVFLYRWTNIHYTATGENLLDTYPAYKKSVTAPLWTNLPNHYGNDMGTNGQDTSSTSMMVFSLLDATNRSMLLWQNDLATSNTAAGLLTYSHDQNRMAPFDIYTAEQNYSATTRTAPTIKDNLDGHYNVIRGGWTNTSDWLSFVIWKTDPLHQNRVSGQNDQLGIEYYSLGDLLIPNGGEVKHLDPIAPETYPYYGYLGAMHNSLLIGNSTVNWSRQSAGPQPEGFNANLTLRGIMKGYGVGDYTPATKGTTITTTNITYVEGNISASLIEPVSTTYEVALPNPVEFSRAVLYQNDYMIVVDRVTCADTYNFTNVFKLGSLNVNYTTTTPNAIFELSQMGNVRGTLGIDGSPVDWLNSTYKAEYDLNRKTNSVTWNTTNIYGDPVNLQIFTAPRTNYSYQTFVTRIGGTDNYNEVKAPQVYFNQPANKTLYRVTALLSKYANGTARTPSELSVTGTGSAIKVVNSTGGFTDYIYTGTGNATFGNFSTDADTVFIRNSTTGGASSYFLVNGTYLADTAKVIFSNGTRQTSTDLIVYEAAAEEIPPVAAFSADVVSGTAPLTVAFTDASTNTPTGWSWAYKNATVGWTVFNTSQNPVKSFTVGLYDINLTATNGDGSDDEVKTGYINVTLGVVIPVASFISDRSVVRVPGTIMFNDTSTNTPTSWLWYFSDGQANVTAQNVTHKYIKRGYLNVCLIATNVAGNGTHCETIRAIGF